MKNHKKLTAIIVAGLLLSLSLSYIGGWYWMAHTIKKEIGSFYERAHEQGIIIEGDIPEVKGFPKEPVIIFRGTIKKDKRSFAIPLLKITGIPLPGRKIHVDLPEGLLPEGAFNNEILSIDSLTFTGLVPHDFPQTMTVENLREWRDSGEGITVQNLLIHKKSLQLQGNAHFNFDDNLQPAGHLQMKIKGHMSFLGFLEQQNIIKTKETLLIGTIMASLSQQDPESGERYIDTEITLQNRKLLLGPWNILTLPTIIWPYNSEL